MQLQTLKARKPSLGEPETHPNREGDQPHTCSKPLPTQHSRVRYQHPRRKTRPLARPTLYRAAAGADVRAGRANARVSGREPVGYLSGPAGYVVVLHGVALVECFQGGWPAFRHDMHYRSV